MTDFMDYMISSVPIKIVDRQVDSSKLTIPSICINQVGYLPRRFLKRESVSFDHWAIAYVVGGKGTYRAHSNEMYKVEPGDLFFVWPDETFDFGPDEHSHWDEYYIRFEGPRIHEWLENGLISNDGKLRRVGVNPQLISKIEMILTLINNSIPINVDHASILLESLLLEFKHVFNMGTKKNQLNRITDILEDIGRNVYQHIDVERIAIQHCMSVTTLRRVIKQFTGYSFNEYCNRIKVTEAKRLLLDTDFHIKEIAQKLGYTDAFYFSRIFKKLSGVSPDLFRKKR